MSEKKRVLSCAQPTGDLHLGNLLGAVLNYVKLQNEYDAKYGVVDYHSMTMPYQAKKLRENTWQLAFQFLACGVDVENIFLQSLVPEHVELSWIFACSCSYGDLTRMTQFKDKSDQVKSGNKDSLVSAGLFFYPVLQAADILIYHADYVPVGKDQEQHLELSRSIANRFNSQFKVDYFTCPEPLFSDVPKVLSTADPTRKMSKSLGDKHHIKIFDDPARITKQIKSAVTDSGEASTTMSPGVENLFSILKASGNLEDFNRLSKDFEKAELRYSDLKETVASSLIKYLEPIQENYKEILSDKKKYKSLIKESSAEIRKVAQKTLKEVREITGLQNLK